MYLTVLWKTPYFVTFLLAIPASAFMVRLFIFFHDCSHGSYLASPRATKILGTCLGILVFMPFFEWRALHAGHHSTSGNLDRRGSISGMKSAGFWSASAKPLDHIGFEQARQSAIPAMQSILPFISEPLPALFSGLCATCSV
jgi:fatty acid desaturase